MQTILSGLTVDQTSDSVTSGQTAYVIYGEALIPAALGRLTVSFDRQFSRPPIVFLMPLDSKAGTFHAFTLSVKSAGFKLMYDGITVDQKVQWAAIGIGV